MNCLKKVWLIAVFILVGVEMTGCGNGSGNGNIEVNIGYFNNITHAQALLMKSEGSLEDSFGQDVKVNWTAFNAGPAEVEALFAENIDIGFIGPVPAISANVKSKGDVVVLAGATQAGAIMITRKDSGVESVADLSGKNVAIPQMGNTQHLCLLHLLEENGLKPVTSGGDVTISAVSNADVANMMERGDIDAALVPEPWGATLLEQGAELLLDYDEIYMDGKYDVALVVVRKEFMEENPELVEKFLQEHEAATGKIREEQDTALAVINAELQSATGKSLSESIMKESFQRIGLSTDLNREAIMGFAEISKKEKFISDVPEEGSLFSE